MKKLFGGPTGYRVKLVCRRLELSLRIIINRKKEPYFRVGRLMRYVINGSPYVTLKGINFRNDITVVSEPERKFVAYNNETYVYPNDWSEDFCVDNFNALLNEQCHPDSPHKYLSQKDINTDWIIYDLGAAEGYQAKQWSKKAKKVLIFEPIESWSELLEQTFQKEIEMGKVQILNVGVSDREKTIEYHGDHIRLMPLDAIVAEYNLPAPDYVKVDIEGEEINFLAGANKTLNSPTMKTLDICVYHRPNDYRDIQNKLSDYPGTGRFTDGVIVFNRDGEVIGDRKRAYHPVLRKCLYRYQFDSGSKRDTV